MTLKANLIFQLIAILATLLWKWSSNETTKDAFLRYLTVCIIVYGLFFVKWFMFWKGGVFP